MKKPIPFGKYLLLERVNVGGMAEVFKAKAFGVEGFERLVAVKRILPSIAEDQEFITMFIDEAKIAVQLTHANIAQIFDLGKVADSYFIAMEFVRGKDMRAIFDRVRKRGGTVPVPMACYVTMKVCEGLDYAHNKRDAAGRDLNLVHRDVSPQNILVSYDGEIKLIDFGIAKAANKAGKTQAGILKGKFGYMSPEQVRGLPLDRRSDVFSVGIVLYELLTGERLFVGESDFSTLEKVRNVEIMPPSTYNRKIPEELEQIVLKALAKDVDDRYQTAMDLHDDLQSFMYTSGNFFARKDLSAYQGKAFVEEIAREEVRDEQYRKIKAPAAGGLDAFSDIPPGGRGSAKPMPAAANMSRPAGRPAPPGRGPSRPPPPPPPKPRYGGSGPPPRPSTSSPLASGSVMASSGGPDLDMDWDEEELATHVYDKPDFSSPGISSPGMSSPGMSSPGRSSPGRSSPGLGASGISSPAMGSRSRPGLGATGGGLGASAAPVSSEAPTAGHRRASPRGPLSPVSAPPISGPVAAPPPAGISAGGAFGSRASSPGRVSSPGVYSVPGMSSPGIYDTPGPSSPGVGAGLGASGAGISSPGLGGGLSSPGGNPSPFDLPAPGSGAPSPFEDISGNEPAPRRRAEPTAVTSRPGPSKTVLAAIGMLTAAIVVALVVVTYALFSDADPGQISFTTVPADPVVFFDNHPVPARESPFVITNVEPDTVHLLEVRRSGYRTWSMQVEVREAQELELAQIRLSPEEGAEEPEEEAGTGFALATDPVGAKVFVDGRELEQPTPVEVRDLRAGRHTIRVEAPGRQVWQTAIDVSDGQVLSLPAVTLEGAELEVHFDSEPRARVTLLHDGERESIGRTPVTRTLTLEGRWEAEFTRDGYEKVTRSLRPEAGQERLVVDVELEQEEREVVASADPAPRSGMSSTRQVRRNPTPPAQMTAPVVAPMMSAAAGGQGTLRINTRPWSMVYVDGRLMGHTPQMNISLSAGNHRVTLVNPEFSIRQTITVTILAGQTVTKIVTLNGG